MEARTNYDVKWIPSINMVIIKVNLSTQCVNNKLCTLSDKNVTMAACFLCVEIREGLKVFFVV